MVSADSQSESAATKSVIPLRSCKSQPLCKKRLDPRYNINPFHVCLCVCNIVYAISTACTFIHNPLHILTLTECEF